jgi:prolyl oligopeptidase
MPIKALDDSSGSKPPSSFAAAPAPVSPARSPKKAATHDLTPVPKGQDSHAWLEVDSPETRDWISQENEKTKHLFQSSSEFEENKKAAMGILFDRAILPRVAALGNQLSTVWINLENPYGDVRGVEIGPEPHPFEAYKNSHPDTWESKLRISDLREKEGVDWTWAGAKWFQPDAKRAAIGFSDSGKDAKVIREYDAEQKMFVTGKNSFNLTKPGFSTVDWYGKDTLIVQTDMGPGSLTRSGQPRCVAIWSRGQALEDAQVIFRAKPDDASTLVELDLTPGYERLVVGRKIDRYNSEVFIRDDNGILDKIHIPSDVVHRFWRDQLLLQLCSEFKDCGKTFESGSLIVTCADSFLNGKEHQWQVLFKPTERTALAEYAFVGDQAMVLNINDQVVSRLEEGRRTGSGDWVFSPIEGFLPNSTLKINSLYNPLKNATGRSAQCKLHNPMSDRYFIEAQGFLMPSTLMAAKVGGAEKPEVLKATPTWFDAQSMRVDQYFATSKDSTQVPYFVVRPRAAKLDGKNPTILDGYGGFSVSLTPFFEPLIGKLWLEKGGIYVQSNIRGGGEFGPSWHQAGSKGNRQNGIDDHKAVARDLIDKGFTSPEYLGLEGGSLGGLLVAAVMVQCPHLCKAVYCVNPVLDMERYTRLAVGQSRIAEYGDPSIPKDWAYLSKFSPYHNIPGNDVKMPSLLITTANDDRVDPAHARKMAARMKKMGHTEVYFREGSKGGHTGSVDKMESAVNVAEKYAFFASELDLYEVKDADHK